MPATETCLIRYNDSLLLHSVPNSMKRENVSILPSYDILRMFQSEPANSGSRIFRLIGCKIENN